MDKIDTYNDGTGTGGTGISSEIKTLNSGIKDDIFSVLSF